MGPRLFTNLALSGCPQPHVGVSDGVLDVRSSIRASGVWLYHSWVDLLGRSALDTYFPSGEDGICWLGWLNSMRENIEFKDG